MSKRSLLLTMFVALGTFTSVNIHAAEPDLLDGDTGLACEALLCLAASGGRPTECTRSIRKYFSIKLKKPHKTLRARLNFLKLCPTADAGSTAQTIQDNYGSCGVGGYESATCSQIGYSGQSVAGFCDVLDGNRCTSFTPGLYFTEEGEVAGTGTYGLCTRLQFGNPLFQQLEFQDDTSCHVFRPQNPFVFGEAAAIAAAQ